jgi:hypothetical protein
LVVNVKLNWDAWNPYTATCTMHEEQYPGSTGVMITLSYPKAVDVKLWTVRLGCASTVVMYLRQT